MSFKTNIKLIFLLLASLICIYDLKYLFPFIITFLILKIHNLKKSKKKENNYKSNIETFMNKNDFDSIPFIKNIKVIKMDGKLFKEMSGKELIDSLNLEENNENINIDKLKITKNKEKEVLLGILFSQSSRREYNNFMLKIADELGLSSILNNSIRIKDINSNNFQELKTLLQKLIIQIFIDNYYNLKNNNNLNLFIKEVTNFDYNIDTNKNYNYDLFNFDFILEDYILNNNNNSNFNKLNKNFFKLLNTYLDINLLEVNNKLELNKIRIDLDDKIKKLGLFSSIIKNTPETERKKKYLYLHFNFYILIIKGLELEKKLSNKISDSNNIKDKLIEKNKKEDKFSDITGGISLIDIFHNSIFISQSDTQNFVNDLFLEIDTELEEPEEAPSPSNIDNDINPIWYQENELKSFYDLSENQIKANEELEKYYKVMNFKPDNLKQISYQADKYNEMLKIKNLSFYEKIDEISTNLFKMIDEIYDLINKYFYEIESISPSMDIGSLDFYINLVKDISNIITKDERIITSGLLFILISLFLYFIDNSSSKISQEKNLYELLNDIRI
tara:strand:+ start:1446 stop:3125 length:1680 start_codon:yes stop_codon:yes gene_type:complete